MPCNLVNFILVESEVRGDGSGGGHEKEGKKKKETKG